MHFSRDQPSMEATAFLDRIQQADPNSPEVEEDDTNESWGHQQFTAGCMTISSVLQSWASVGNAETACKLISATIKTCKVARQVCFKRGKAPRSYLSDSYLENLGDRLWTLWQDAGGVRRLCMQKFPANHHYTQPVWKGKGRAPPTHLPSLPELTPSPSQVVTGVYLFISPASIQAYQAVLEFQEQGQEMGWPQV